MTSHCGATKGRFSALSGPQSRLGRARPAVIAAALAAVVLSTIGTDVEMTLGALVRAGRLGASAIHAASNSITRLSVCYRPEENAVWVAHGRSGIARLGTSARDDLPPLLLKEVSGETKDGT